MAKSSVVGKTMRKPVILVLIILLITLIAAFAGNFYLAQQKSVKRSDVNTALLVVKESVDKKFTSNFGLGIIRNRRCGKNDV